MEEVDLNLAVTLAMLGCRLVQIYSILFSTLTTLVALLLVIVRVEK